MALQSEISPRLVGDANKDTKIDGDTKSDGNSSSDSTDDVDLEEGEILDSGEEEEEKKDFTNSSLKEALDKSCLQSIQQLVSQAESGEAPLKNIASPKKPSPRKMQPKGMHSLEGEWFPPSPQFKGGKFEEKPFDYKKELAAYRGTPPSSPDRKRSRDDKQRKKRLIKKLKSKKAIKRKDIKGQRVSKYKKEPSSRQQICRFYKEGKCAKGSECTYSHTSPPGFKKKELCKFYLNSHCNKGKECLYMHSEFPCKFYHTGSECYAKDDCKFSHSPLGEEMKRVLADYLNLPYSEMDNHIMDRRNPKRPPSPDGCGAPPPTKRASLLGPPPRHIREAEETRRWQEEMRAQLVNHPGFEIKIIHEEDEEEEEPLSPMHENHNYYPEDRPSHRSPPRPPMNSESSNFVDFPPMSPPPPFQQPSPNGGFSYEAEYEDMVSEQQEDFGWKNVPHCLPETKEDPPKPLAEPDFTSDVQFEETTQFSEMESSADAPEEAFPSPIVVPSHLPRKQRELFMRIQQHQRRTQEEEAQDGKEEEEDKAAAAKEAEELWYSSEEEEDARPLTDILKKMNQELPVPKKTESESKKPADRIMEMLSKIQQKATEKSKAQPTAFWEELLSGTVPHKPNPAVEPKRRTLLPNPQMCVPKVEAAVPKDPRLKSRDPRTLVNLSNKADTHSLGTSSSDPRIHGNVANSSDPRNVANNSDTRSLGNMTNSSESHVVNNSDPRTIANFGNNSALPLTMNNETSEHHSSLMKVSNETSKENSIPYRLHGIYTKPPNYTPYIHASHSNPNLLKDPRLRRHLSQQPSGRTDTVEEPVKPALDVPPIPKLLLKYENTETIDIFKPSSTKGDVEQVQISVTADPRMRRRDSRSQSGSDTPPRLMIVESLPTQEFQTAPVLEDESAVEKKWLPPVLEKGWAPPPILEKHRTVAIKKEMDTEVPEPSKLDLVNRKSGVAPAEAVKSEEVLMDVVLVVPPLIQQKAPALVASHLPKAIADPRMAKLHSHADPRRSRVQTSENKIASKIFPVESVTKDSPVPRDTQQEEGANSETEKESKPKTIPKKRHVPDKVEEKKKTVHRNRKSSMDYASPLNSCDAPQSLSYNSYNQRPKRKTPAPEVLPSVIPETNRVSEFVLADLSALDCDTDVNLKDRFKTIDPTASPFC